MTSGVYNPSNSQNYQQGTGSQTAQQTNQPGSSYGQTQALSSSVNIDYHQASSSNSELPYLAPGPIHPVLRTGTLHNLQQQRSANSPQAQYDRRTTAAVGSPGNNSMTTDLRYIDYNHRQLPSDNSSRIPPNTAIPSSARYADRHTVVPPNVTGQCNQHTITVDSMDVYDSWPEYHQQGNLLAPRSVKDARKDVQEAAHQKDDRWREQMHENAKESERTTQPALHSLKARAQSTSEHSSRSSDGPPGEGNLEAEIRGMVIKMREIHSKNPKLMARVWEEERRVKAPSSPSAQPNPAPRPVTAQTGSSSTPVFANQGRRAVPKEGLTIPNFALSHAQTSVATRTPVARSQSRAVVTGATPPTGNTVWPAEKKGRLAAAAAAYLNDQNPTNLVTTDHILNMLEGKPSYIELCEHLEAESLKVDRAAFAKSLLTAVPGMKSGSRSQAQAQAQAQAQKQPSRDTAAPRMSVRAMQHTPASPTIMKKGHSAKVENGRARLSATVAQIHSNEPSYPQVRNNVSMSYSSVIALEVVPANSKPKPRANKEEATRKRNFLDIIDLTSADDEDEIGPMHKRHNVGSTFYAYSSAPTFGSAIQTNKGNSPAKYATTAITIPSKPPQLHVSSPSMPYQPHEKVQMQALVKPLDTKMALRRNVYNIKTIARDVLLACGRHPTERQLNAHLDILKTSLAPSISNDSDLNTLRWDLIDPGKAPKDFYRDGIETLVEDADDEDDSEDEIGRSVPRSATQAIGVGGAADARVQASPPTNNPLKQKRRGRPPRRSYPDPNMNASASPPKSAGAGIGYAAFRSATEYDAEGKPLPRKKGRPVGWRKAIHGSAAAQQSVKANKQFDPSIKSSQSKPLDYSQSGSVMTKKKVPNTMYSRSPSATGKVVRYQTFDCKWQNCKAKLHNLETLKKHVHKRHRKETENGGLKCLWDSCGEDVTRVDPITSIRMEIRSPFVFTGDSEWRNHLELRHFVPLSWELGDGPATGLSDVHDSETYLSDSHGRQVTPRITVDPSHYGEASSASGPSISKVASLRGRGRPPRTPREQEARDAQARLVFQKKRLGGPGIDRSGSTLVNEKRRRGFSDDDRTEELVDTEE